MKKFFDSTVPLLLWIAGLVIAKGFWSTAFAICLPPYAWYLVTEVIIKRMGQ